MTKAGIVAGSSEPGPQEGASTELLGRGKGDAGVPPHHALQGRPHPRTLG